MYKAIVAKVNVFPHPMEKYTQIQCASVKGCTVIVSKSVATGDLGVFFPSDGRLSHDFAMKHSLYKRNPETGLEMGGKFSDPPRVKAMKFGGVKSDGFWMPISCLDIYGKHSFQDGDEIDTVNGNTFCEKYYTPATLKAMARNKHKQVKASLKDKKTFVFPKHFDTAQLKFHYENIPDGALVSITEKIHGTSHRMVLTNTESANGINVYKYKSFEFGVMEGYLKDDENYSDIEEVA